MNRRLMNIMAAVVCLLVITTARAPAADGAVKRYTESFTSKVGDKLEFEMVLIPGGQFMMGSGADEAGRKVDEGPQHEVKVDPFYLCTTEATLDLFLAYYEETNRAKASHAAALKKAVADVDALTGPTPVFGELTMGYSKKNPAMGMTWHNAMNFCKWLSKKTHNTYRLPTEAEWEYAAKAGSDSAFGFGDDAKKAADYAWFDDNSDAETHPVAQKKPNAWGLFDMAGNVREWVYDFYSADAYTEAAKESPAVNPKGAASGKVHVARGGDYFSTWEELRPASRAYEEKWWRDGDPQIPKSIWWLPNMDIVGFRVARSVDQTASRSEKLAFASKGNGEYVFDTGVLRGALRRGGRSTGLSSVVHVPSGRRIDAGAGLCGFYRIFTKDKRYGTAAWSWPSESKLLDDGAVEVRWPASEDRPFELTAVYRWATDSALDVETTVKAQADLSDFEVFLASYFDKAFPVPHVYAGKDGFLQAKEAFGDWQMFPQGVEAVGMIRDGRWKKQPNPVDWAIMPELKTPLAVRRGSTEDAAVVLMAPPEDCFAIATPYEGEGHYSLYASLFGRDVKAGDTATAKARFAVAATASDAGVLKLYAEYMKDIKGGALSAAGE